MSKNIFRLIAPLILVALLSSTQLTVIAAQNQNEPKYSFIEEFLFNFKIKAYMRITNMPSITVCVLKDENVVWSDAYGYSNLFLRKKAKLDSIYVVGSISKTIIATAIMQLYERKYFDLDDNVSLYLPFDIKNPKYPDINVTFRMLLAHQSSIRDNMLELFSFLPLRDDPCKWIEERLIPGEKYYKDNHWNDYPPGENISYSNFGFILLSALIEKISGLNYEEYCQKNIFGPLNMSDTSFELKNVDRKRLARPYYPIIFEKYFPLVNYDIKCVSACGGLRTTVTDLSNFFIVHMNNGTFRNIRILNESTLKEMHTIQYPTCSASFYLGELQHGLGWIHLQIDGELWEGYNGGAIGYSCNMMFRNSDKMGIILFSNGHFKRIGRFIADFRIHLYYQLADMFIDKAKKLNDLNF